MSEIAVLDHGYVRLLDHMGDDLSRKTCIRCHENKGVDEFSERRDRTPVKRVGVCKTCHNEAQKRRYDKYKLLSYFAYKTLRAKKRADSLRVPFDLDSQYLSSIWTGFCPILGIPLNRHADRIDESAAELDRFDPSLGYTKGNVSFISRKMNRLKNNASIDELKKLLAWMEDFGRDTGSGSWLRQAA